MSRSGYSEGCDYINLYRATVDRAINGKRGQAFLKELAKALDDMPDKKLIREQLVSEVGECCTIGAVCKARGIDVSEVDPHDPEVVGKLVGISRQMAAEIEFENDERCENDTTELRWTRMRKWVSDNISKAEGE